MGSTLRRRTKGPPRRKDRRRKMDPHSPQRVSAWCWLRICQDSKGKLSIDRIDDDQGSVHGASCPEGDAEDWWVVEAYVSFETAKPSPLNLTLLSVMTTPEGGGK